MVQKIPASGLESAGGSFKNLFIPPYCDDSGLSLGAAQYLYHHILKKPLIAKSRSGSSNKKLS